MNTIYETTGRAQEYSYYALNIYKGCPHGCLYCYVPMIKHMEPKDFHAIGNCERRQGLIEQLEIDAPKFAGLPARVQLCFICDPYPANPIIFTEVTRQAIEILRKNDISFQVLTKGGLPAARDFDLYGPSDIFGVTLTTPDEGERRCIEPNAAPVADRIETLKTAYEKGIYTWISIEPTLDAERTKKIIETTSAFVNHYKIGALNYKKPSQIGIEAKSTYEQIGKTAIDAIEKAKRTVWIKESLAKYIASRVWEQTDTRRIPITKRTRTWSG